MGEAAGCSKLQLKFGVARFQGASQTAAARAAGYQGNDDALRRAGYAACRSTGVQNLLELAAVNAPATAAITDTEINAKIAKLVRSSDSNVSLKAMDLHAKRQAAKAAELAAKEDDGDVDPDQADADLICAIPVGGIGAAICLGLHYNRGVGRIAHFTFLKEVAPLVSRKFPENWQRWRARCDNPTLKDELDYIDQCAAGPLLEADALIAAVRAARPKGSAARKTKNLRCEDERCCLVTRPMIRVAAPR